MAQKEIVMQQIRTGKMRDLPILARGQLGLASDAGRMFVGLPSASDPASLTAGRTDVTTGQENIEIITEFTPYNIINKLMVRAEKVPLPANGDQYLILNASSRVFIEYVAYGSADTSTVLETGSVQMAVVGSRVLISQQNNTNSADGLVQIDFSEPTYDEIAKRFNFKVHNGSTEAFVIEMIYRSWDE